MRRLSSSSPSRTANENPTIGANAQQTNSLAENQSRSGLIRLARPKEFIQAGMERLELLELLELVLRVSTLNFER